MKRRIVKVSYPSGEVFYALQHFNWIQGWITGETQYSTLPEAEKFLQQIEGANFTPVMQVVRSHYAPAPRVIADPSELARLADDGCPNFKEGE